tara:strand:- start:168 stop:650 length:483 start_codon:yes stop_codon:yes gene_type:complete
MPSLDIQSEIDSHELLNAIDQANRVISNRYDFKGTDSKYLLDNEEITLNSQEEFQINQMMPILRESLVKRKIDLKSLDPQKIETSNFRASQKIYLKSGIDRELAKKITTLVKQSKLKIQAQIQGEQIRISGKKRDDLQSIMTIIKDANFDIPLQFVNFRD